MTNQEAIEILKQIDEGDNPLFIKNGHIAMTMAIKALEQEPCDDAVSRKEVINQIFYSTDNNGDVVLGSALRERIARLPSVNPQEPKTGHWITQWNIAHQKEYYYCSECREEFSYDGETGIKMNDYDYCPNCGAKMVEPQESEDKE